MQFAFPLKVIGMQKSSIVMCINDSFLPEHVSMFNKMPVKGELYMIREIIHVGYRDKRPGLTLEEIYGKNIFFRCNGVSGYMEFHFFQDRFVEVLPPMPIEIFLAKESVEESVFHTQKLVG